jgi:hypothetical protein
MNNFATTGQGSITTAQAAQDCLELLFVEVSRNPFGDEAKYGARMIVRQYGERVSSAIAEISAAGLAHHNLMAELDNLTNNHPHTEGNTEMWNLAFDMAELQEGIALAAAENAAKAFESVADLIAF